PPASPKTEAEEDDQEILGALNNHGQGTPIQKLLDALMRIAATCGSIHWPMGKTLTPDGEHAIKSYCDECGFVAKKQPSRYAAGEIDGYLIALPLAQYAAVRLSHLSGKEVTPDKCGHLESKPSEDHYSVIEWGLLTETWATSIPKAEQPIGLLMSQFDAIQKSWIANGKLTRFEPREASYGERVDKFLAVNKKNNDDPRAITGNTWKDPDDASWISDQDEPYWIFWPRVEKLLTKGWSAHDPDAGQEPLLSVAEKQEKLRKIFEDEEVRKAEESKANADATAQQDEEAMRDEVAAEMANA
ncbi:MAG: hypothetical protein WCB58_20945, partial [Acidobacteriaceae bacterium]